MPALARRLVEQSAVVVQRLSQRDRAEHGDATPGFRIGNHRPTAVVLRDVFRPLEHGDAGFQVFRVARDLRHVQERIDRIHAAPVDEIAGRAAQRAVPGGIGRVMDLHGQHAIAPVAQQVTGQCVERIVFFRTIGIFVRLERRQRERHAAGCERLQKAAAEHVRLRCLWDHEWVDFSYFPVLREGRWPLRGLRVRQRVCFLMVLRLAENGQRPGVLTTRLP